MYLCYLVIIFPSKKAGLSFEQTWIPFTQECFVCNLVEIGLVVLEKKMKMWKVHDKDNKDNDNNDHGQAFGLGELKTAWCNKIKTLCML